MSSTLPTRRSVDRTIAAFRLCLERDGELYSLTRSARGRERWPATGIVDAACEQPLPGLVPHQAPASGCRCGAYAVDSLATVERLLADPRLWRLRASGHLVTAAVLVWSSAGRPVIVGELTGALGYQYRAPHMRVLALAESPAACRVAERHRVLVLPAAGLEAYAREHGDQLRPGPAEHLPEAEKRRPVRPRPGLGAWLIDRMGRWARPRAPWAWTVGLAVMLTLVASAHLAALVAWWALRLTLAVLAWLLPRLGRGLLLVIAYPIQAVLTVVVAMVLMVTAWVWAADLVKGVVQL